MVTCLKAIVHSRYLMSIGRLAPCMVARPLHASVSKLVSAKLFCCGVSRAVNSKSKSICQSALLQRFSRLWFSPALSRRTCLTLCPPLIHFLSCSHVGSTMSDFLAKNFDHFIPVRSSTMMLQLGFLGFGIPFRALRVEMSVKTLSDSLLHTGPSGCLGRFFLLAFPAAQLGHGASSVQPLSSYPKFFNTFMPNASPMCPESPCARPALKATLPTSLPPRWRHIANSIPLGVITRISKVILLCPLMSSIFSLSPLSFHPFFIM